MASLKVQCDLRVPGGSGGSERRLGSEVSAPRSASTRTGQATPEWCANGEVGPLALSFDAEMGAGVLEGDLQLPAGDKPLKDIDGSGVEIGTEEGLRLEFADWIADQQPSKSAPGAGPSGTRRRCRWRVRRCDWCGQTRG